MTRARSSGVGSRSIGSTRSYVPMGTMARGDPCVDVVMANRRPGISREAKARVAEKTPNPGPSQPRNSRARPSASTDTCWW